MKRGLEDDADVEESFTKMFAALGDDPDAPVAAAPPSTTLEDEDVSAFSIGYVKARFPDKGYSYLTIDPSDESSQIIIDSSIASPNDLAKCHAVAFKPSTNDKGEVTAASPTWLLVGKVEPGQEVCWGAHVGVIDRMSSAGDAWINAPTAIEQYGDKPYIFRKVLTLCELQQGDEVRFDVHVSPAGKPQVQAPMWRKASSRASKPKFTAAPARTSPASQTSQADMFDFSDMTNDSLEQMLEKELLGGGKPSGGEEMPEDMMIGIVQASYPEKGFSYLTVDPSDENSKVFIHTTVASPAILERAGAVAFKPHYNAKGECQASAPVWLLMGRIDPSKELKWGSWTGTVSRIVESGDGYVSCPEVSQQYGKDPYIFRKVAKMCEIQEGDEIRFDVHVNARNQPQVPAPIWKKNNEGKGGGKSYGKGYDGKGKDDSKGKSKGWDGGKGCEGKGCDDSKGKSKGWDSWQSGSNGWGKGKGEAKGEAKGGGWESHSEDDSWETQSFAEKVAQMKGMLKGAMGMLKGGSSWGGDSW